MIMYLLGLIPTVITGVAIYYIQRRQRIRDTATDIRAETRKQESLLTMRLQIATLKLSKATAVALRDGHTNGETREALAACKNAEAALTEFLRDRAYDSIVNN